MLELTAMQFQLEKAAGVALRMKGDAAVHVWRSAIEDC